MSNDGLSSYLDDQGMDATEHTAPTESDSPSSNNYIVDLMEPFDPIAGPTIVDPFAITPSTQSIEDYDRNAPPARFSKGKLVEPEENYIQSFRGSLHAFLHEKLGDCIKGTSYCKLKSNQGYLLKIYVRSGTVWDWSRLSQEVSELITNIRATAGQKDVLESSRVVEETSASVPSLSEDSIAPPNAYVGMREEVRTVGMRPDVGIRFYPYDEVIRRRGVGGDWRAVEELSTPMSFEYVDPRLLMMPPDHS